MWNPFLSEVCSENIRADRWYWSSNKASQTKASYKLTTLKFTKYTDKISCHIKYLTLPYAPIVYSLVSELYPFVNLFNSCSSYQFDLNARCCIRLSTSYTRNISRNLILWLWAYLCVRCSIHTRGRFKANRLLYLQSADTRTAANNNVLY